MPSITLNSGTSRWGIESLKTEAVVNNTIQTNESKSHHSVVNKITSCKQKHKFKVFCIIGPQVCIYHIHAPGHEEEDVQPLDTKVITYFLRGGSVRAFV